MENELGMQSNL